MYKIKDTYKINLREEKTHNKGAEHTQITEANNLSNYRIKYYMLHMLNMLENPPQGTKNEAKQYHTTRNEQRSQAISHLKEQRTEPSNITKRRECKGYKYVNNINSDE